MWAINMMRSNDNSTMYYPIGQGITQYYPLLFKYSNKAQKLKPPSLMWQQIKKWK
jgi:hypothetical protein